MRIELRSISQIKPYETNPRKITPEAVAAVAQSLGDFGFRQPIVVDSKGVIIVGHVRYQAALKLELKKVPVHVANDLTPAKIKAYRLADNATGELTDWDYELLPIEIEQLKALDYDVSTLGFSDLDLTEIMNGDRQVGLADPDDIPAPPDAAITKPGDIIVLGQHRLMCGDSSHPDQLDRLLGGQKIHLVNTDPPYNVKVEPRSNNAIAAGLSSFEATHHQGFDSQRKKIKTTDKKLRAKDRPLANDFVSEADFDKLLAAWFGNISRVLIPGRAFYIWGGFTNCGNYPPVLKALDLFFSQAIIWVKNQPVLTRKDFMTQHEWCFYGWRAGAAHQFYGPNNARDVWDVKKVASQQMVHLTEKPTELAARAMEYSSKIGENVLDLFGGSGSTMIAAEQTGRKAFLMELDPLYCDVIIERWEKFTGQKAKRIPCRSQSSSSRLSSESPSASATAGTNSSKRSSNSKRHSAKTKSAKPQAKKPTKARA